MTNSIIRSSIPQNSHLLLNFRDSLRRHFVDYFYSTKIALLAEKSHVLDLGGTKNDKRGLFNIDKYNLDVIYVNYSTKQFPDVQADGRYIPFVDEAFDCIVCAELMEHIKKPIDVLAEVYRVLRPGSVLLLTVPFMFPVHADPSDYGRYTDQFWLECLSDQGFTNITIEWQGGFWCVLADMLRGYGMEKECQLTGISEKIVNWMNVHLQKPVKKKVLKLDESGEFLNTYFMKGCTTGFGVSCYKQCG